ncbi:MAG: iron-sulfur cluster carrier protein [Lysobacteraceae bacterium]|nr:MAG: iron-sulfur cluster carrier protein [Xanthomonadaceae bacterium]
MPTRNDTDFISMLERDTVAAAIDQLVDSNNGATLGQQRAVAAVAVEANNVAVELRMSYPDDAGHERLKTVITEQCRALGAEAVSVDVTTRILGRKVQKDLPPLPGIGNIIPIASGKGGVGKSTVAANLAMALKQLGARVGLLDADIYGPSQPRMMGVSSKPESEDGQTLLPNMAHGIPTMSVGYMVEEDTPMIWRGPMVTQALTQLLQQTAWGTLDYLIVDLPPGTGDIQLTMAQKIPVAGSVIVTTPQDISLLDARKALKMFEKVEIPVLGLVENMSTHICSNCGHEQPIFGHGGGQRMAAEYNVNLLGSVPLDIAIREQADLGTPVVEADPQGAIADSYRHIARRMAAALALRPRNLKLNIPDISLQS